MNTYGLTNCARCGGVHLDLSYRTFARPVPEGDGLGDWTHWALCPTNGEPILMRTLAMIDEPSHIHHVTDWEDGSLYRSEPQGHRVTIYHNHDDMGV